MTGSPTELGVLAAAEAIRRRELTSADLVEACLARVAATDGVLQAWVTVDAEGARAAAARCDVDVRAGRTLGPLAGVPIGLKDLIDVAGLPTASGAPPFAHTHPTRDATLVARLRAAGAVILGKTVPTAFAYKDPAVTTNPWSLDHTPGGSSSGSAAAVAARQVPATVGTQTAGSILRPAAYCGVVGLKGAHGWVPLDGVAPLAWSLDHAGPFARSVRDAALVEDVMAGTSTPVASARPARLGVSVEQLDQAGPGLRRHLDRLIGNLTDGGARVVPVTLPPSLAKLVEAGRIVLEVEAAAAHEAAFALDGHDYPAEIAELIRAGLARRATDLVRAERVRAAYRAAVWPVLATVDALLSPVAPGPAPLRKTGTGDFTLCAPWSFVGAPSISLPIGLDDDGLPLAVQLTGAPAAYPALIGAAAWVEGVIAFEARPAAALDGATG